MAVGDADQGEILHARVCDGLDAAKGTPHTCEAAEGDAHAVPQPIHDLLQGDDFVHAVDLTVFIGAAHTPSWVRYLSTGFFYIRGMGVSGDSKGCKEAQWILRSGTTDGS